MYALDVAGCYGAKTHTEVISDVVRECKADKLCRQYQGVNFVSNHPIRCLNSLTVLQRADSPREYACPSEGEERAALYNMACCYAKLGEVDSGMAVLRGLLENGFEDLDTLRNDEDVEGLRSSPEFEQLLVEASSAQKPGLFGQKKRKGSSSKGWLDRW
jgi:hypothetical protein